MAKDLIIFIILTPQENTDIPAMSHVIADFAKEFSGKIIVNILGGNRTTEAEQFLEKNGVLTFEFFDEAIKCLSKINKYTKKKDLFSSFVPKKDLTRKEKVIGLMDYQKDFTGNIVLELPNYMVSIFRLFLCKRRKRSFITVRVMKSPFALKISSPRIIHRNKEKRRIFWTLKRNRKSRRRLIF